MVDIIFLLIKPQPELWRIFQTLAEINSARHDATKNDARSNVYSLPNFPGTYTRGTFLLQILVMHSTAFSKTVVREILYAR